MDHIETAILNCYGIREAEQNMVFAARLTQHGHTIQNMADLMDLYHQSYSQKTVENIAELPHRLIKEMAEKQGVTETLKAEQPWEWIGLMNNIQACAREVVNSELICA